MLVTSLIPRGKTRTGVTFDEDVTVVLSNTDLQQYGIREGAEITPEEYHEILQIVRAQAVRKCAALLQGMDYTELGLQRKLISSGFPEEVARSASAAAKDAGLVNDLRYAQNYITYHIEERSRLRIRRDLLGRGVDGDLIDEAFRRWEMENQAGDGEAGEEEASLSEKAEIEQIRRILCRRRYDPEQAGAEERNKLLAFLQYRGYSPGVIRRALEETTL